MTEFDRDVAVAARGDGRFDVELAAGWVVGGGVNGGYLLAVVGTALRAALPSHPDPIAVSSHYVSASTPGPAEVVVDVRRQGGSVATAAVDLVQDGALRISALATCGDLGRLAARGQGVDRSFAVEPVLPPLEDCLSTRDAPPDIKAFVPMLDRFDLRLDPAHSGWAGGVPGGTGIVQGWFRLADEREPDVVSLLTVCDVLPPTTFDFGMPGWAPTLELSVHVRAHPALGWLKVRHQSRTLLGGMFEEDAEVWDSAGRLVAQSRQLALQPRLPG